MVGLYTEGSKMARTCCEEIRVYEAAVTIWERISSSRLFQSFKPAGRSGSRSERWLRSSARSGHPKGLGRRAARAHPEELGIDQACQDSRAVTGKIFVIHGLVWQELYRGFLRLFPQGAWMLAHAHFAV